jgi:4-amino-4-deoxy-L-arabinose transferase-like glycosyltransferase
MDDSERRISRAFLLALGLYFLLQLIIRVVHQGALELDEAEQVFDAQQLLPGYGSQPPLYAWLQWLVFQVFGVSHFSLSVLKNALLFALYASVFQLARLLLGTRAAAAISSSLVLLIPLGWEVPVDRTHSLLATALAAGALWTYFALLCKPGRLRRALLGLLLGLGMQSKYNFAIFLLGFAAASLLVREHRRRIWTRDMWITVGIAVLCLLPHAFWFVRQVDTATAETLSKMIDRDPGAGYVANVANGFKHLLLSIASFVTPLWIVLVLVFQSPRQGTLQWKAPHARFFLLLYGIGLAGVAALVLSGHLAHIRSRWLQPLLFSIPLACFVILAPKQPAVYRRLLLVAAVAGVGMLAALFWRPQLQAALGKYSRIFQPYPQLATELTRRFPEVNVVAVQDRYVGGNVRLQLPRVRVLLLDQLCRQARLSGDKVLVLVQAGSATEVGLVEHCKGMVVVARGRVGARATSRHGTNLLFDFALVEMRAGMKKANPDGLAFSNTGRSTRIRTLDPLVPNQVRYRAALHSEDTHHSRWRQFGQGSSVNEVCENCAFVQQAPTRPSLL